MTCMQRRLQGLAMLLLALALPAAGTTDTAPAESLKPFKATYTIRRSGFSATGDLTLQQLPDGRWSYDQRVHPRGLARMIPAASRQNMHSVFRIVASKVVPDTFSSDDKDQRITFDWEAGRVTGTVDRRKLDLPTQPGLLDELSVQAALMQELLSGRVPTRFMLLDEGLIKDYIYAVEGSEIIESAVGTHRVDIFSSRRPGSKKANFYWCAPDLGYIPLKVERRNGRDVELSMTLTNLER